MISAIKYNRCGFSRRVGGESASQAHKSVPNVGYLCCRTVTLFPVYFTKTVENPTSRFVIQIIHTALMEHMETDLSAAMADFVSYCMLYRNQ